MSRGPLGPPLTRRRAAALASAALVAAVLPALRGEAQSAADEKIIVSGASGNLGGLAVEALLARGVPASRLILVSRTPAELAKYAELGADTRYGDFTEPESLPAAYAGGRRMLLVSIGGADLPEPRPALHKRAIDAAAAAGVEHIAYTSWIGISGGETTGLATDHLATERMLEDSGVAWTMLRNSIYMDGIVEQAAGMVAAGRAVVPRGEVPIGYVTRADCAEAAAAVLATPGHENKAYDITGPAAVGTREIAQAAAAVTGRPIAVVEGGARPAAFGGPELGLVSPHVEQLTGDPPTSVREMLAANREALLGAVR
jgi:NAD(P)H dehydrogenase (quinone)